MSRHLTELAKALREHAAPLGYLSGQGVLKQQLYQAADELEKQAVTVTRDGDGKHVVAGAFAVRVLTRRERLALWLLRGKTEVRP